MTSLRVMWDTLHFQASFIGDQGDSFERFTKEVNKHMKEAEGTSRAHRKVIEVTNERVTRRRREVNDLNTLVSICVSGSLSLLTHLLFPRSRRWEGW